VTESDELAALDRDERMESEREQRHERNLVMAKDRAKEMITDAGEVYGIMDAVGKREIATCIARCMNNLDTACREYRAPPFRNEPSTDGILAALHNLQRELLAAATTQALGELE